MAGRIRRGTAGRSSYGRGLGGSKKGGQINMRGSLGAATSAANTGPTGVAYKKANRGQGVRARRGFSLMTSSRMP